MSNINIIYEIPIFLFFLKLLRVIGASLVSLIDSIAASLFEKDWLS